MIQVFKKTLPSLVQDYLYFMSPSLLTLTLHAHEIVEVVTERFYCIDRSLFNTHISTPGESCDCLLREEVKNTRSE